MVDADHVSVLKAVNWTITNEYIVKVGDREIGDAQEEEQTNGRPGCL